MLLLDIIQISPVDSPPREQISATSRTETWVQVNKEEHLPGDRRIFKIPEAQAGRMKMKTQVRWLKQIIMACAKERIRTAI